MEKSNNSRQLAPQRDTNVASGSEFMDASAPPSYEEATAPSAPALPILNATGGGDETNSVNTTKPNSTQIETVQQPLIQQPVVLTTEESIFSFGPNPISIRCPTCGVQGMSHITSEPSTASYLLTSIFCLLGCWICILLAYCNEDSSDSTPDGCAEACITVPCDNGSCMERRHYCRSCNKFLGSYSD